MNCKTAKQIDLIPFLNGLGYSPTKVKSYVVWFKSPFREERTASFKVDINKNRWFDFGEGIGGTLIDLVLKLLKTNDVAKALEFISENTNSALERKNSFYFHKQPKRSLSSKRTKRNIRFTKLTDWRLKKYLKKRCISQEFHSFLEQGIERKNDKAFSYLAFKNDKGGYELRNAYFKSSTHPKWITIIRNDPTYPVYVFEGFFDFLSVLEIAKRNRLDELSEIEKCNFLILNSTALINAGINALKPFNEIRLFLDNDNTGKRTTEQIVSSFPTAKDFSKIYEGFKDMNEFLMDIKGGDTVKLKSWI